MARLALIHEVVRVQTDVWVVAVDVIQPDLMVHDLARLLLTDLTDPAVYGQPFVYVCLPGQPPGLGFIELFLVNMSRPPTASVSAMPTETKIDQAPRPSLSHYHYTRFGCAILCTLSRPPSPSSRPGGTSGTSGTRFSYIP